MSEGKPVANSDTWRRRMVLLQHNFGEPIVRPKVDREKHRELRKALKKLRRAGLGGNTRKLTVK